MLTSILPTSSKIYLAKSNIAGRGIFAKVPIKKNEIIEVAPVIILSKDDPCHLGDLKRFVFRWKEVDKLKTGLVMGYGSFYNHSKNPSAEYVHSFLNRTTTFIATRDIEEDEEITIDYGYNIKPEDIRD